MFPHTNYLCLLDMSLHILCLIRNHFRLLPLSLYSASFGCSISVHSTEFVLTDERSDSACLVAISESFESVLRLFLRLHRYALI